MTERDSSPKYDISIRIAENETPWSLFAKARRQLRLIEVCDAELQHFTAWCLIGTDRHLLATIRAYMTIENEDDFRGFCQPSGTKDLWFVVCMLCIAIGFSKAEWLPTVLILILALWAVKDTLHGLPQIHNPPRR